MSMNEVSDLRDTIVPKSDQLNAEQLLGGPITVTVTGVRRGSSAEQPLTIHYEGEGGRPYKPCKTMRKVLVFAWGEDGNDWIGRSMTLYNRPDVKFGGDEVGGIRISHLSHIDRNISVSLTATRGRKEPTKIQKLEIVDPTADARARLAAAARGGMSNLQAAWGALDGATKRAIGGTKGCPDELKQVAVAADAKTKGSAAKEGPPADTDGVLLTVEEMKSRFAAAETLDALDDAYNDVSLFPDAERKELHAAYELRRDELELQ